MKLPLACSAAALLGTLAGGPAHAELIPVSWDAAGRFAHEARVAPGKFTEVCEKLQKGIRVEWDFRSTAPLDFNIHYHVGKEVDFPFKQDASLNASGVLNAALEQDYCWMWSNKQESEAALSLRLKRE